MHGPRLTIRRLGILLRVSVLLIVGPILPDPALAQVGAIEGLLKRVTGVPLYGEVGMLTRPKQLTTSSYWPRRLLGKQAGLRGSGVEFIFDVDTLAPKEEEDQISFEVALGYDHVAGFIARDRTLDLRGVIRELPRLSLYATLPFDFLTLNPYVRVSTGLVQLSNVQGYDTSNVQYAVDGTTYEVGVSIGLYRELGERVFFFTEAAYRNRKFDSLKWGTPSSGKVPAGWPRSLDMNSGMLSAGIQFRIFSKGP